MTNQFLSGVFLVLCALAPQLQAAPLATTTNLSPSLGSVSIGTVVTLTASVTAGSAGVSPGLVTFYDGKAVLGSAQLVAAGTASMKLRLGPGAHSIRANFAGTNTYAKSTSSAAPVNVSPIAPTAAISYSDSNNGYTFTGTLTSVGAPAPSGKISFLDQTSATTLGSLTLGIASEAFLPQQNYGTGANPSSAAVGDFNNDGVPDLAIGDLNDNTVSVLLGNGDGTFQPLKTYAVGDPTAIAAGDFNSDGILDLAVTNGGTGAVNVLLGKGDGTFHAATTHKVSAYPDSVAVGDFNGDGIPDLVVAINVFDSGSGELDVLLGRGDGSFLGAKYNSLAGTGAAFVAVGDFNGDGLLDLVVAPGYTSSSLSVLLGNGDGTFQPPLAYAAGEDSTVVVADFNGDGFPDLLASNPGNGTLSVLLNNGNGTFQPPQTYTVTDVSTGPGPLGVGDFNADGFLDVAWPIITTSTVSVLNGNGNGTFQAPQSYYVGAYPQSAVVGDFNGDGLPDLAVTSALDNAVSVLLNQLTVSVTLPNVTVPGTTTQSIVASYGGDLAHQKAVSPALSLTPSGMRSLTFMPTSLAFGNEAGPKSAPQTVTVTNSGTAAIYGISVTIDGTDPAKFAETTTCGTSLAVGASCTVSVTFMPTSAATYAACLTIHSDAPAAPEKILLSGTGLGVRSLTFSPASLPFGNAVVGTAPALVETVTNNGSTGVYNILVALSGADPSDFAITSSTCGTSLAPGATCSISVTFKPPVSANYAATLVIHSDAPGAPENIPITGTGTAFSLTFNPTSVYIAANPGQGVTQNVTVTSNGTATVSDISLSLVMATSPDNFSETTTCGTSLVPGVSCTITVLFDGEFAEFAGGFISGTAVLEISSNVPGSPFMIPLGGYTNDCDYQGNPCQPEALPKR